MINAQNIEFMVDGEPVNGIVEPRLTLADFLRDEVGLTGIHLGCEHGVCGSCTILLDGRSVRSCLLLAVQADQCEVTTVAGLAAPDGTLNDVQRAFSEHHALQCGFCTPGFIITVTEMLQEEPTNLSDEQLRQRLAGNLCRCTGYHNIVVAVKALLAAEAGRGRESTLSD